MIRNTLTLCLLVVAIILTSPGLADESAAVKEQVVNGPNSVNIKVRMEGPYTADTPLQVVCYFKYTKEGAKRMTGAPVELDKRLGGGVGGPCERGPFTGGRVGNTV